MEKYAGMVHAVRTAGMQRWAAVMETQTAQGVKRTARVVFYPLIAVGSGYSAMAAQAPFTTGFITTGVKTTAADLFAQLVVEKKEKVDWRRNALFTTFGFCYLGGFQYWLYNVQFTKWCGFITKHAGHLGSAPVKTFIDQFLHHPMMYFPVFYSLKATVEGRPILQGEDSALTRYRAEAVDCWQALWKLWVPCTLFNFTFMPRHLRIPFVAATSAVWTVTLSVMQGAFSAEKDNGAASSNETASTQVSFKHQGHDEAVKSQVVPARGVTVASMVENTAASGESCGGEREGGSA